MPPGPAATIASATLSGVETIRRDSRLSISSRCGKPSVATKPGSTSPTCTPFGFSSAWRPSLQPISANLLAEYAAERAREMRPATLATFTIDDGAERRRIGSSACVSRSVASKFSFMCFSTPSQPIVGERAAPRRAGVVDQQVEPAVLGLDRLRDPVGRVVVGQVDRHDGRAAELVGERAQPVLAPRDQHELRAVAREPARGCLADPARGACDERDHAAILCAAAQRARVEHGAADGDEAPARHDRATGRGEARRSALSFENASRSVALVHVVQMPPAGARDELHDPVARAHPLQVVVVPVDDETGAPLERRPRTDRPDAVPPGACRR